MKPIQFDGNITLHEALVALLRVLFDTITSNESAVIKGRNPEALHDFRVAIRRTRTLLGELGHELPDDMGSHYKGEFKWLFNRSGPTRDLDVYLETLPQFSTYLPEEWPQALLPLHRHIRQKRQQSHSRLAKLLKGRRYRRLIKGWQARLDGMAAQSPQAILAQSMSSRQIKRCYDRFHSRGYADYLESHPEAYHELRKTGKKLRYLLELFQTLYPRAPIQRLIKSMMRLQDALGKVQDLKVQQVMLRQFAQELGQLPIVPTKTIMALGIITERLRNEQTKTKHSVQQQLRRFVGPENQTRFNELFVAEEESSVGDVCGS